MYKVAEYIIVGDTEKNGECLVYICGKSKEHAEDVLHRMMAKPTYHDRTIMMNHKNLRIKEVQSEHCWWNYGCD